MERGSVYDDRSLTGWEEIACELGISRQGVIRIYDRAMRKLRRYYNNQAHRAELRLLLSDEPGKSGHVAPSDRRFPKLHEMSEMPVYTTTRAVYQTSRLLDPTRCRTGSKN